ncbi:MAG: SIMPL domain-containing protein [Candidatus Hydrogenedentes bacterium]|nr:SIMPL domain-containing protein [Candidatus Hydrogenedentota bacterium]
MRVMPAISLKTRGEATGAPDSMRIYLQAEATAGVATDALRQCNEKAATTVDGIAGLGIAGATVTREMFQFSSPASGDSYSYSNQAAAPAGARVCQVMRVEAPLAQPADKLALATQISAVFDVAARNGVNLGSRPAASDDPFGPPKKKPVEFVLADYSALRALAVHDAITARDSMREQLAEAGVRTGHLLSVGHYKIAGSGDRERVAMIGPEESVPVVASDSPDSICIVVLIAWEYALVEG